MNEAADNDVSDVGGMDSTAALSIRHTNSLSTLFLTALSLGVGSWGKRRDESSTNSTNSYVKL